MFIAECGAQFSLALAKSGQIWTWGKGDYFRLGHGTDQHIRKPTLVDCLKDKVIVHVAVGALHCLAVTDSGQVRHWTLNFEVAKMYFFRFTRGAITIMGNKAMGQRL